MKRLIALNLFIMLFLGIGQVLAGQLTEIKSERLKLDLMKAIDMAMENNPGIMEARDSAQSAYHGLGVANSLNSPRLSAGYSLTQLDQQPYSAGTGTKIPVEDKTNFSWDITASQPLFTGFAITSQCGIASKTHEISKFNIELVRADTCYLAKKAYISKLLAEKMVKVAEDSVESLKSHEADAQKFYGQGMIPYSDVLKARVGLASAIHNLENARSEEEISTQSLGLVLNIQDINEKDLVLKDLSVLPDKPEWVKFDDKAAFDERPEMKILKLQSAMIDDQIRLSESSFYPKVYLLGKYEQNGKDIGTTEHNYRNRFNTSLRIQADWTLFEGGKTLSERSSLKSQKRALSQRIAGLENRIRLDLTESLSKLRVAEANYKTASSALGQAKENWRITNLQFTQQMATASDVLDARFFLSRTETDYYRSLYGCHLAMAAYVRALGKY